jgi:thymidylate synthase
MIKQQLDYVVEALVKDNDSRQAVLTIWRPSPAPSKDIPCTVSI